MISFIVHTLKLQFQICVESHSTLIIVLFDNFSYHTKNGDSQSYEKNIVFMFISLFTKNCHHKNEQVI